MENKTDADQEVLDKLAKNVYVKSVDKMVDAQVVKGYDFNNGLDY